jgi:hypothetical protein
MERRGIVGSASLYYDLARCLCAAGRSHEALMQVLFVIPIFFFFLSVAFLKGWGRKGGVDMLMCTVHFVFIQYYECINSCMMYY